MSHYTGIWLWQMDMERVHDIKCSHMVCNSEIRSIAFNTSWILVCFCQPPDFSIHSPSLVFSLVYLVRFALENIKAPFTFKFTAPRQSRWIELYYRFNICACATFAGSHALISRTHC